MKENIPPEEKLLNLIKNSKKETKNPQPETGSTNIQEEKGSPVSKKGKAKKVISGVPAKRKTTGSRIYSLINRLLVIAVLLSLAYSVLSYFSKYKSDTDVLERKEEGAKEEKGEELAVTSRPLSYYTDVISGRQIFKVVEAPVQKQAGPAKPKITLSQLLGGYTFVGIIFGDVPQAIVEEKKSGQSFYLTEGQMLGEIKIDKIEEGKITVTYEEETMDVRI